KFYQNFGIEAEFTSHPLRDVVKTTMAKDDFLKKYNLSKTAKKIFLMPGSRKKEFEIHMPIITKALSKIKLNHDIEPLLLLPKHMANLIAHNNLSGFRVIIGDAYNAMHHSDLGIVASGTATLEAALSGNPFAVIYKTSLINYLILKPLVKVPQIGMVNLIIGHEAMPELIQYKLTPQKLQNIVLKMLNDADYYKGLKAELCNFKDRLGQENAAQKAAEYILGFLNKR
ncbi:MAG: hypothetical protein PHQ54_02890, partial [Candidatus Omnitrophica bacterium]|nr:hypothetical protein [Candidatus Omnitrophota bacterium]